ncbi:MAG: hypothetical protein AAF984_11600, partial [Verrucomicrobiota bacterium]
EGRYQVINYVFFGFWLLYTIYAYFVKSPYKINKHALLISGSLGLCITIVNGIQTELWLWKSLRMGYPDSFLIDVSWMAMGIISFYAAWKAKPMQKKKKRARVEEEFIPAKPAGKIITDQILTTNPSGN